MLEPIYLPEQVTIEEENENENEVTFGIFPYFPGYGPTIGNALRRVLLSSLPGAAITHVKIEGADHEFSTVDGVKEDLVSLTLNLKRVRIASDSDEPVEIVLKGKGVKNVTAGDFETPPGVEVANKDSVIATLTDKNAEIELRCVVEQGRGYAPSEAREDEQRDIGMIALDSVFTPVQRVSFRVENVRVGQATDYHKLLLTISTDGTVSPADALRQAAGILADHFKELAGDFESKLTSERPAEVIEMPTIEEEERQPENTLNQLQLPSRVHNALERVGITTVEQVLDLSEEQIQDVPGLGEKAIQDILNSRDALAAERAESNLEVESEDEE